LNSWWRGDGVEPGKIVPERMAPDARMNPVESIALAKRRLFSTSGIVLPHATDYLRHRYALVVWALFRVAAKNHLPNLMRQNAHIQL